MQPPENADQETLNKWHTLAIQDCDRRIINLENAPKIRHESGIDTAQERHGIKDTGHWYTSIGIWLAIILVLGMLYLIWLVHRYSMGYHIILPEFMR